MTQFFHTILARPWVTVAVLALIGVALALAGLGTPGAAAFMLAGMLIMVLSGRQGPAGQQPGTDPG